MPTVELAPRRRALIGLLALLLGGCAAPKLTPQLAAEMGYEVLGPQMQYDDKLVMAWIPATPGAAPASAAASPFTAELARLIAAGARQPIHVTVSGDDSAFTAQVIKAACAQLPAELSKLRLVFIGNPAHEAEVRQAVLSRRATFYFEPAP
jgi:hypothetical protein